MMNKSYRKIDRSKVNQTRDDRICFQIVYIYIYHLFSTVAPKMPNSSGLSGILWDVAPPKKNIQHQPYTFCKSCSFNLKNLQGLRCCHIYRLLFLRTLPHTCSQFSTYMLTLAHLGTILSFFFLGGGGGTCYPSAVDLIPVYVH